MSDLRHFRHLEVPEHWERYWSKYPNGYTVLEALISWVSQVDNMVDNQNKMMDKYDSFENSTTNKLSSFDKTLTDFLSNFDTHLQDEVSETLEAWQTSGFLELVINEALQTKITEVDGEVQKMKNLLYSNNLVPYYVEGFSKFSGKGVPSGISKYDGGNFYLGISGTAGDSFVTVKSGNILDAGGTWVAVIKDDSGNWDVYQVLSTNGVETIQITPNLKTTITNGEIGNLHDAALGQHYTERGYFAFAQHFFKSTPKHEERNRYIEKFKSSDTSGKWVKIGAPYLNYNNAANMTTANGTIKRYTRTGLDCFCYGNATTQGIEWEQNLKNKNGFLETFVSTTQQTNTLVVEFLLDGVLVKTIRNIGKKPERLLFDYSSTNSTAKLRIFVENNAVDTNIIISDTTFWVNEKTHLYDTMIPPHSKVVYNGDSWGEFHNQATTRQLEKELSTISNTAVRVTNESIGGMTTAWAMAWFKEHVLDHHPTHVVLEFFVNDMNTANGTAGNFTAPDGTVKSLRTTQVQWRNNLRTLANLAIANGIQPIIICPCGTDSESQAQGLSAYNVYLTEGTRI